MNPLNNKNWATIYKMQNLIYSTGKVLDENLRNSANITMHEFLIMISLERNPGCEEMNVAQSLGIPKEVLSNQIKPLYEKEYVNKIEKNGESGHILIITDIGKQQLNKAHKAVNEKYQEFFITFSENDRKILDKYLDELLENVNKSGTDPYKNYA